MKLSGKPKLAERQVNKREGKQPSNLISFGPHQFRSPLLFASYRYGDFPVAGLQFLPWRITETEALLINAYDFQRPKYQPLINNGWNPAKHLDFKDKPLLIDSGAYYFLKHERLGITPEAVLDLQIKSKADVGVALDHPFPPEAKDKAKRINHTIRNTRKMLESLSAQRTEMSLMPVVHGHTRRAAAGCLQRIKRIWSGNGTTLERIGIGSLAPLAQRGSPTIPVEIIAELRRQMPDAHIHCFSMGSALLMLLAFYCGADTVDSQSWIVSAAFKYAQLPGNYMVRMGRRDYKSAKQFAAAQKRFASRMNELARQEAFFVKDWSTGVKLDIGSKSACEDYVRTLIDVKSNENIHNRACHNLWVFNSEVKRFREEQQKGTLDSFIDRRLTGTRYFAALQLARKLRFAAKND